jgi:hypothetical protein
LCSESTGSSDAARLVDGVDQQPAGADQRLLVGERHHRAAPRRHQGRRQAGIAHDRGHHPFGRPRRRLDHRLGPAAASIDVPTQRVLERPVALRIGDHRHLRLSRRACSASASTELPATSASTR